MSKLLDIDVNKRLLEILGECDLELEKIDDYCFVDGLFPGISALAFEMERFEESVIVQLDIHILLPNQHFVESFIGHAETTQEALNSAFEQFEVNILHTLIMAFWDKAKKIENGVGTDIWEINGARWQLVISNYGYRGDILIEDTIEDLDMVFDEIEKAIKSLPLEKDIYAFRTVYTNTSDGDSIVEALINNEPFIDLEQSILNLPWRNIKSHYSIRNLVIAMKLAD